MAVTAHLRLGVVVGGEREGDRPVARGTRALGGGVVVGESAQLLWGRRAPQLSDFGKEDWLFDSYGGYAEASSSTRRESTDE